MSCLLSTRRDPGGPWEPQGRGQDILYIVRRSSLLWNPGSSGFSSKGMSFLWIQWNSYRCLGTRPERQTLKANFDLSIVGA